MSEHDHPKAVGGKLLAKPMPVLLALFGLAVVVMLYRFVTGVGPVSNMTDGYTWGIWEPVNVVVFTGIGAGAYGVGLLCYLLNKGKYHGLVRPAVLVGAICYTLGASSIVVALGRYWNAYWLPWIPYWNLSSALLEVAVCVLAYVIVLWIEVVPSVLDGAAESRSPKWSAFGKKYGPMLNKAMPYIIALAILLPRSTRSGTPPCSPPCSSSPASPWATGRWWCWSTCCGSPGTPSRTRSCSRACRRSTAASSSSTW